MPSPEPPTPAAPTPHLRSALVGVLLAILLGALDQTIVGVALPSIARDLQGLQWMAWVVSAYLMASTVATPLMGRFSDWFGRRSVLSAAIVIFTLASVACALARNFPELIAARVLQGVAGGGLIAMAQAVIADVVPLRERGRSQGYVSIVWASANLFGPPVGGVLTQYLSWTWIFWINVPLAAVALVLVRRSLASLPVVRRRVRIDWLGAVLLLCGLTAFLLPITRIGHGEPLLDRVNSVAFVVGLAASALFALHERRVEEPILPLGLLRDPPVLACNTIVFVCFFLLIAMSTLVPLRMQWVLGLTPSEAGLRLLPLTLSIPATVFISGRWMLRSARVRPLLRVGSVLLPLSLVALAFIDPARAWASSAALTLFGVGLGLQMPTAMLTVQNAVPTRLVGTVTGLTVFSRLLGGAIGIAVLSSIVQAHDTQSLTQARGDLGFQVASFVAAAVAMLNMVCGRWLPDVRLDSTAPATQR